MRIRPYELFQGNVLIGYRNILYVMPKVVICPASLPIVTPFRKNQTALSKLSFTHPKILATIKLSKGYRPIQKDSL